MTCAPAHSFRRFTKMLRPIDRSARKAGLFTFTNSVWFLIKRSLVYRAIGSPTTLNPDAAESLAIRSAWIVLFF